MQELRACIVCLLSGLACVHAIEPVCAGDDSEVHDDTRDAAIIKTARQHRLQSALLIVNRNAPAADSWNAALEFEQGIDMLRVARAPEAVPALLKHFAYERNLRLSLSDRSLLNAFPATGALAEIGTPAIPGLIELAKNFTCDVAGHVHSGDSRHPVYTTTLLLHTLYAAAGDATVIDEELKAELARLKAVKPPDAEIKRQTDNLARVLEEAERMYNEGEKKRRQIEEYQQKLRSK